jgi:hypothetical protein
MTLIALSERDIERSGPDAWRYPNIISLSESEVIPRTKEVAGESVPPLELGALQARLRDLADLRDGWDSYGAPPIDRFVLAAVTHLLERLPWDEIRPPQVVPTSLGGITLEWHRPGLEFSVEVRPDRESNAVASAFFADDFANDSWEENLRTANQARLITAFRRVAAR